MSERKVAEWRNHVIVLSARLVELEAENERLRETLGEAGAGECRFFLGRRHGPGLGTVALVDGCHSDAEGVVHAAKLMGRIFKDAGPWVMVQLHPMLEAFEEGVTDVSR